MFDAFQQPCGSNARFSASRVRRFPFFSIPDAVGQGAFVQMNPAARAFVRVVPFLYLMEFGYGALGFKMDPFEITDSCG